MLIFPSPVRALVEKFWSTRDESQSVFSVFVQGADPRPPYMNHASGQSEGHEAMFGHLTIERLISQIWLGGHHIKGGLQSEVRIIDKIEEKHGSYY